jgi:hypothetical protein
VATRDVWRCGWLRVGFLIESEPVNPGTVGRSLDEPLVALSVSGRRVSSFHNASDESVGEVSFVGSAGFASGYRRPRGVVAARAGRGAE